MGDPPPEVEPDENKWAEINAAHRFNLIHRWNFVQKPGKLLDVGCWTGFFMKALEKRGWKTAGVEPVDAAAQWGRQNLKLDIRSAVFEKADFQAESFDMITLMHTLEHLPDPDAALERANKLLRPGGVIALETPNADCLAARILGRRWRQFISRHVAFFTPVTIARLLKRHGFENVRVRRIGRTVPVRLVADRIKRYYSRPLGNVLDQVFRITGLSNAGIRIDPGDIMFAAARKK
jgi:2-polyprenyl-3-methyl-5-hydroxy-6-metoxy-1,4-benzoquinol methylase